MFLSIYLCIAIGKNEEEKKRQALFNIVCIIIYLQILKMSLNNIIRNTGKINVQSKINTNKYKYKKQKNFHLPLHFPRFAWYLQG
jgi:hypothetical protein